MNTNANANANDSTFSANTDTDTRPKVLILHDLPTDTSQYQQFTTQYNCIHYTLTTRQQLINDFHSPLLNDIIAIFAGWLGFSKIGGFNTDLIAASPMTLKLITVCSVGYQDGYDIELMSARGIHLTNVPHIGSNHVADLVLYHTLQSFRMFHVFEKELIEKGNTIEARVGLQNCCLDKKDGLVKPYDAAAVVGQEIKDNDHNKGPGQGQGPPYAFGHQIGPIPITSPYGKKATIIGFGNIGRAIAYRLKAIGMSISYVKRTRLPLEEEKKLDVSYYPTILEASPYTDLLILAIPGTPQTYHMVNEQVLSLLKPGAKVINVGRGTIIDEEAALKALKLPGSISFLGLDVFHDEPKVNQEFLQRDDVLCTPHIGSATMENYVESCHYCLENIDNFIKIGELKSKII